MYYLKDLIKLILSSILIVFARDITLNAESSLVKSNVLVSPVNNKSTYFFYNTFINNIL